MEVLSVLLVGSIVTYFMYQNISKITSNLDVQKGGSFESYAHFASAITDHIRKVKNDLDKDIDSADPRFCPNETCDTQKTVKALLDLIRKTAFFETVMAKRKTPKEVESALGEILAELDEIIKKSCVDGEKLAEEVKESLYKEYQKIHA